MTTRVAFDPVEMRWAARLLEAIASQLRSNARSFEREQGALGEVTPGMRGYVGDSLQELASRTRSIAKALEQDGLVLSAVASFIEAAEGERHLPDINLRLHRVRGPTHHRDEFRAPGRSADRRRSPG